MTDSRNQTECLLNMAMDHIAWTLEQPTDPRAWRHLLSYCPLEILEAAHVRMSQRRSQCGVRRRAIHVVGNLGRMRDE